MALYEQFCSNEPDEEPEAEAFYPAPHIEQDPVIELTGEEAPKPAEAPAEGRRRR